MRSASLLPLRRSTEVGMITLEKQTSGNAWPCLSQAEKYASMRTGIKTLLPQEVQPNPPTLAPAPPFPPRCCSRPLLPPVPRRPHPVLVLGHTVGNALVSHLDTAAAAAAAAAARRCSPRENPAANYRVLLHERAPPTQV